MGKKLCFLVLSFVFIVGFFTVSGLKSKDGSEEWGYVQVRPKAHMFWWLYKSPNRVDNSTKPWPTILWLQGGPGASGVAIGNFQEVGPLDTNLKPRNSTWLQVADLLFVDNPVGTGYSFVENEDKNLFVKTDVEAANDLTVLLKKIYNRNVRLQNSPLYIVAESYGGKFAVTLGLSVLNAIGTGKLKLKLGGIALGNTWISPEDFVFSWGPLLKDVSRLDKRGAENANNIALTIKQQIHDGKLVEATQSWDNLESQISHDSNGVNFYNFLEGGESDTDSTSLASRRFNSMRRYSRYLSSARYTPDGVSDDVDDFMNRVIRKKLKIIPKNVTWGAQDGLVFDILGSDFMRPRINEVDELLAKSVNVTIYSGQLDVICATKGTEAWLEKLKWDGLEKFQSKERKALYCGGDGITKGFTKSYKNLHFYWILKASHFVPVDQPCVALKMVGEITQSPASGSAPSSLKMEVLM
jgi:serine carboxypeptidase 1